VHQCLSDLREQRGVGELEEKKTNDEGAQAMVFEENGSAGLMSFSVGRATGAAEVDVGTADPTERPKQRDR
jgi:hypothetical protein